MTITAISYEQMFDGFSYYTANNVQYRVRKYNHHIVDCYDPQKDKWIPVSRPPVKFQPNFVND